MKYYNFKKAKHIIELHEDLIVSACLGMHEDWFWTAEDVWSNGVFTQDLDTITKLGGINGSKWATPTLQLNFKDGSDKMIEISEGETTDTGPGSAIYGVLSGPAQDNITPITEKI